MRLLSIFALLFLISLLLHGGLKDRSVPTKPIEQAVLDEQAEQDFEEAASMEPVRADQEDFSSFIFNPPYPAGRFDFEHEPAFSIIEMELKNLIVGRNDDSFNKKNNFCAVGYEFPRQAKRRGPGKREVIVYWREAKTLYRWKGGDPKAAGQGFYNVNSLLYSRSIPLEPNQDVIGKEGLGNDLGDYKERAEKVIADCEKHGKAYEVEPFMPPPRGFEQPRGGGRPRPSPAAPPTLEEPGSSQPTPDAPASPPATPETLAASPVV